MARLRAFPPYLDAWTDVVRDGIAAGVTSPRVVVERSIDQLERVLALGAGENPAMLPAVDGDDAARERVAGAVRDVVNPALADYLDVLGELLPHATGTVGLRRCPAARSSTPRRS